jgi:hypothetical protein
VTGELNDALQALLEHSLGAWRLGGKISREVDGTLLVAAQGKRLRIARAPAGLPFRWTVAEEGRMRHATSVTGILRHVRAALDGGHRAVRLRIAPLPKAP